MAVRHGMRKTPEYTSWANMLTRCYNRKSTGYARYGGAGVVVCNRWRRSFLNFYRDMGPKPSPLHSIDRYPVSNGNYEPSNCRWATIQEQAENRSIVRWFWYQGKRYTLTGLSRKSGVPLPTLKNRLDVRGMSVEEATSAPQENVLMLTYRGETKELYEWANEFNMKRRTLSTRIGRNWSIERALTTPVQKKSRKTCQGN